MKLHFVKKDSNKFHLIHDLSEYSGDKKEYFSKIEKILKCVDGVYDINYVDKIVSEACEITNRNVCMMLYPNNYIIENSEYLIDYYEIIEKNENSYMLI